MLTFLTFCTILGFILLGSFSLRRHVKRISKGLPWESELTEAGRAAQNFEHRKL